MSKKRACSVKSGNPSLKNKKSSENLTSGRRFIEPGDGTLIDFDTGLMWAKDIQGKGCNYGRMLTWKDSIDYAKALSFAGYSDWRLPTIKELVSIVDYSKLAPATYSIFEDTPCGYFWSSSEFKSDTRGAWVVGFDTGRVNGDDKSEFFCLRCVRNVKKPSK